MNTPRRFPPVPRGTVLALAALAMLASGCSGPEDLPSALVDGGAESKPGPPESEPIEFGAKPLWDKNSHGDHATAGPGFNDSRIVGDLVVHSRIDEDVATHLTVSDAETGKTKWKLAETDPIPGGDGLVADFLRIHPLGESAEAKALLIEYRKPTTLDDGSSSFEYGVAAVSVKTGELLWHAPVVAGREYDYNLFTDASSANHVAVRVSRIDDDSDDLAVVGVKQHKVLWRKPGLRPSGFAGGTVLARTAVADCENATLLALNAADGEKRWDLGEDDDPKVLELTPEAVVASVSGAVAVLDPKTGDTVAEPNFSATDCAFDGKSAVACQAHDENDRPESPINVIALSGDSAKARQVPKSDTYSLTGMYRGRIFTEKWANPGWDFRVLGPDGRTLAEALPGRLVDISDRYAVFTVKDKLGDNELLVHSVTA